MVNCGSFLKIKLNNFCFSKKNAFFKQKNRSGVLEDVLGLEDTIWSPWPRWSSPWPWAHSKMPCSRIEESTIFCLVENGSRSWAMLFRLGARRRTCEKTFLTHEILEHLRIRGKRPICLFFLWDRLKFLENLENFWAKYFFLEHFRAVSLVLGLARVFCVLGLETCVLDSTSAKKKTTTKYIHITVVTPLNRYFCQKNKTNKTKEFPTASQNPRKLKKLIAIKIGLVEVRLFIRMNQALYVYV